MHMKSILIVSDDPHTRAWVSQVFDGLDATISYAAGGEMQRMLLDGDADLAIVDGGRDPLALAQVVEHAASSGADVRLLLLVEPEVLSTLRLPVRMSSDFMVRGGTAAELLARVRTLLWPGEEVTAQEVLRIDELTLNLATYQAHLRGQAIDFTYLEYALFAFLVTHPGRTYSREVLLRRVWGSDYYGGSRTVDVHIRRIRAKIGAEAARRLETVRNVGYLWNG
jgi:DNA-binding response OmpR family regulator